MIWVSSKDIQRRLMDSGMIVRNLPINHSLTDRVMGDIMMRHIQEYEENILLHLEKVNAIELTDRFRALQLWQSDRLLNTHRALYEQPRFKPAMDFFRDELYSAAHFHRRNKQLIRALPLMCSTMPDSVLGIVADAAQLHSLSLEMDTLLMHYLPQDINIQSLTMDQWVAAYRACDNPEDRALQIELIERLGNELKRVVKKPMVKTLVGLAKVPARVAGYQDIHQFVTAGFHAFEHLDSPDEFLVPVIDRERALSVLWFQGIVEQ